jgi:small subunit ribosomal protein S20
MLPVIGFGSIRKTHRVDHALKRGVAIRGRHRRRIVENMANTTSAKAARQDCRHTIVNKSRSTQMRGAVRIVERRSRTATATPRQGDGARRPGSGYQRNIIHKNNKPKGFAAHIRSPSWRNELNRKEIRQEVGSAGFFLDRTAPWGTAHKILACPCSQPFEVQQENSNEPLKYREFTLGLV